MLIFELVIGLLSVGVLLALLADRIHAPYPALLALAGACLALVPGLPNLQLDPDLALALFVSPVLLDAAFDASPRDLRHNYAPVSLLAIGAVCVTIAAVAVVARMAVPGMGWAAAVTLGAIVAPPDASAATAVLRRLRPPHRLLVILEGESLLNDASSLLVYRIAVIAAMTGKFSGASVVPTLLLTCGGGIVMGVILARVFLALSVKVSDVPIAILTQFLSTFVVWMLADRLHLSAIVTMVAYAMTIARRAPGRTEARRRIASYAVWEVVVLVLNVLAFVLIGLQLRGILARLHGSDWHGYALAAAAISVTVMLVRIAFWMPLNTLVRWWQRRASVAKQLTAADVGPSVGAGLLISWCGMRGIVTLAAALALPDGGPSSAFPRRDFIVLAAFCVVLSTLVLQGLTLRPLLTRLGLQDDGAVARELRVARQETTRAALLALERTLQQPAAALLHREYEARLRAEEPDKDASARAADSDHENLITLQREIAHVQRKALAALRASSVIGDDAFHAAEEEIDLLELSAAARVQPNS